MPGRQHFPFLLALLLATLGGAIFTLIDMPLAWMLGAMTATGAAAILRLPVAGNARARPPMSAVIGAMLGSQFAPHTFAGALDWWPAFVGLALYLLIAAVLCYIYLVRVVGLDPVTGYFSAMPGGLIDMVLLGAERGGDERTIALMHTSRIFLVVLSIPTLLTLMTGVDTGASTAVYRPMSDLGVVDVAWFLLAVLAGTGLGRLLKLPAPFLIGPMLCSMALHWSGLTGFVIPTAGVAVAQIVLGTTIGCRFVGVAPVQILRLLVTSGGATIILVALALGFAVLLHRLIGMPIESVVLAFAPGGLAEMSLVALALHLEVSFVVICHISRIGLVILGATFLWRFQRR